MDRQSLKLLLTVTMGAALYWLLASVTLPYAGVLLPRVAGLSPFTVYAAMHLTNWVVLLAISLPVALVLANGRLALSAPVLAASLIAMVGLAGPEAVQASLPAWVGAEVRWSYALDLVKFALTLPVLTWLAKTRLPSNNSSKPKPPRGAA